MSDNEPLVSIIMNCYNGEKYLREAIDSIYAQTYKNWEIIFWDNVSRDSSKEIAQSYDNKLKYYCAEQNTGLGEARNFALKKAAGKYIAFLDTDDLYLSGKLEKQVKLMESSRYPMCYGSAITINEKNEKIYNKKVKNDSGYIFGRLLMHYEINMQSVMLSRSHLIDRKMTFNANLKYCPDYHLFMEIASRHPVAVSKEYVVKYRKLADSLSTKTVNIAPLEIKLFLDSISDRDPGLQEKYSNEFTHAYAKIHYYSAVALLHKLDRLGAIREIKSIVFLRYEYLLIFLLFLLPIPSKITLKLLRR